MSHRSFACPRCGSDQTQTAAVIYAAGTSESISRTHGGGLAFGEAEWTPILGGGKTRSKRQTELAKLLSPPDSPKTQTGCARIGSIFAISAALILLPFTIAVTFFDGLGKDSGGPAIVFGLIVMVAWIVGSIFAACYVVDWSMRIPWSPTKLKARQRAYEDDLEIWNRTCFCHRCGLTFVL